MSTGAECRFTETAPGKWEYWLQSYPYGSNEDGETFGPFAGFNAAYKHLHDNHANPGGHSSFPLEDGRHVHEWETGNGQVQKGVTVQFTMLDLPPTATVQEVMEALHHDGTAGITGARTWPNYAWVSNVTKCAGCGSQQ